MLRQFIKQFTRKRPWTIKTLPLEGNIIMRRNLVTRVAIINANMPQDVQENAVARLADDR